MHRMEIVKKIREYSKYLTAEAVKRQIMTEFKLKEGFYEKLLKSFITGPKQETTLAVVDSKNTVDIHHFLCVLADMKRLYAEDYDKLVIRGSIEIVGQTKLS